MYDVQHSERTRATTKRLDTLHSASYFSPAVSRALAEVGLEHPSGGYLASRAAALGRVPASVVAATFYSFNVDFISEFVPACWETAAPEAVLAARLRGVEAMVAEIFAADGVETAALAAAAAEAVALLEPVLAAMPPDGRPLFAAHAEALTEAVSGSEGPLAPFVRLWAAATLLREFRGDGHIAALIGHDLTGLESVILHTATGTTFTQRATLKSRGWPAERWDACVEQLIDRGLLARRIEDAPGAGSGEAAPGSGSGAGDDSDGRLQLADEAIALRAAIEDATDHSVARSWSVLEEPEQVRLAELAQQLARPVLKAGVFPARAFAASAPFAQRS